MSALPRSPPRSPRCPLPRSSSTSSPPRHALWLGGPPGAGKTSVALRLVRRYGLRWYGSDTRTWAHRDRALRDGNPAALGWEALTPDERRRLAPSEQLRLSLHAERGLMILDDVRTLPSSPLVVVEGSPLAAGLVDPARALWLLPPAQTLLGETIERDAREHDVPILAVDGTRGLDETVAAVEEHFAEALASGPRAETRAERRALLREANETVVEQVRSFYARPWAEGDANEIVRSFVCECGATDCTESLELPVGAVSRAPARADGHG